MVNLNIYSKEQVDAMIPSSDRLVPSTTGATSGQVVTFDGVSVAWATPSGGGGVTKTAINQAQLWTILENKSLAINQEIRGRIEFVGSDNKTTIIGRIWSDGINIYMSGNYDSSIPMIGYIEHFWSPGWDPDHEDDWEFLGYAMLFYSTATNTSIHTGNDNNWTLTNVELWEF